MKDRMRLATAALALSIAGFDLTGCGRETKEIAAETEAADKQIGGAQATDTQADRDQAEDGQEERSRTADDRRYRVALYLSGAADDIGWCWSAYDSLKFLGADYGCEVAYTESLTPGDIGAAFTDYVVSGYGVVIDHGYEFGDPAVDVMEQYPDTELIVAEEEMSADNVASYVSKCEGGGYIMGMLTAGMSENGKVGFIGPIRGASLMKIMDGFEGRAKEVNPGIQIQTAWTGSFADTTLDKKAARAMVDNDADIIGHCANESRTGAINTVKEAKVYAAGNSYDQNDPAPDTIPSSSVYHVPHMIEVAFKTVADGAFEGGTNQLGMADEAVSVAPYHNLDLAVSGELKQKISDKIAAIGSRMFKVTCDARPRT